MRCGLVDMACHIQLAAWEWWAGVGLLNKVLIVGGLVLIILAATRSLLWLLHKIGGWSAVVGAIALIIGVVLAILPKKPDGFTGEQIKPKSPEAEFSFGVDRLKKKRKTIFDGWTP
jgi:hypothetical protein